MKGYTGEQVLRVLVEYERDGLYSGSTWAADIAHKLGRGDGRSVTAPLKRLERFGLVERDPHRLTGPFWRPTEQGRKVDRIVARITFARGGEFAPRREHLTGDEIMALR